MEVPWCEIPALAASARPRRLLVRNHAPSVILFPAARGYARTFLARGCAPLMTRREA